MSNDTLNKIRDLVCKPVDGLPVRIVIGHRGWVWVGYRSEPDARGWVTLVKARCIRRWNTTNGLAELVAGPGNAVLDAASPVRIHEASIVAEYECDTEGWRDALA